MIEFREGDKWCRWNGVLMNPKNHKKLFGVDFEMTCEYYDGETFYTDEPIGKILMIFGEKFDKPEPYDEILSNGYGWKDHCWEERLGGHVMFSTEFIESLKVKPMKAFKKDYPKFNQEQHDAFYIELDKYYEDMRNEIHEQFANQDTSSK